MDTPPSALEPNQNRESSATTNTDEHGTTSGEMIDRQLNVRPEDTSADFQRPRRCNVGRTEQKFRLGAGAALLVAAAFAPVGRGWRIGFAVLGAAELVTGTTRYCPVSHLLGINTCHEGED